MGNTGPTRRRPNTESRSAACILLVNLAMGCDDSPQAAPLSPDAGSLVAPDAGSPVAPEAPALADAGPFGFRRDIHPIFVAHCGPCHVVNGPYHDIASPELAEAYADAVEYADRVVARIRQGNMPPACVFEASDCVPEASLSLIERWISEGLPR